MTPKPRLARIILAATVLIGLRAARDGLPSHFLELGAGRHLLSEQRGLDAVE